jgi:hypothetical protein
LVKGHSSFGNSLQQLSEKSWKLRKKLLVSSASASTDWIG